MRNLLDKTPSQQFKNDDSCGTYDTYNQMKFKTSMLKSSL